MVQCIKEVEGLKLYKHYTGIISDNKFKIFQGNLLYSSVKNSKSYPLECFELVGMQDKDGWIATADRVNLSEFNKEKNMEIDKNDPFMQVLEYLLGTEYENTITKLELEEKENEDMNEKIKSMKTLEACAYLQDHKDEYLVAKDNENFELHYDGKGFYTTFKSVTVMQNTLTLDFSTLNTEWVKIDKKYGYLFIVQYLDKCIHFETQYFEDHYKACLHVDSLTKEHTLKLDNNFYDTHSNSEFLVKVEGYPLYEIKGKDIVAKSIKA